ncbi:MAG: hypothetical protein AAGA80_03560 [Cyanobacteria bacterium P01_F01_bin.143]
MKLVIREYLSMLKESGELEVLLPDLLLAMGIAPLSKAQGGVRQYGVDIAARGIDPDDNVDKLFLLTVKQGNLSRNNWDSGKKQDVRPSLNEIEDVYLTKSIDEEHKDLIKKIIVCCNGDIKQDVEQNWLGYKEKHIEPGIEFDFWGADKISLMIEKYLLDEYLFPEQSRKYLRKTIALADQNEDPQYFYTLIEETLFSKNISKSKDKARKERSKALSILNLSLNIVFHWCSEANNLKPALLCAERSILRTWEWLIKNNLMKKPSIMKKYRQIISTYINIIGAFINKIKPYCFVKHGLFGWAEAEEIEYPLRTFEIIGILGSYGMLNWNLALLVKDDNSKNILSNEILATADILESLIRNNPSAYTPLYDRHANDIALGLIILRLANKIDCAQYWLNMLGRRICQGYQISRHFPIHTNSYNDLVNMTVEKSFSKDKLMKASTIIPLLADWYAILDFSEEYKEFQKVVNSVFPNTNFMQWFPDETTDNFFYSTNAGYKSGVGTGLLIHKSIDDIKKRIVKLQETNFDNYQKVSCIAYGRFSLAAITSRHFQTPLIPFLWHGLLPDNLAESIQKRFAQLGGVDDFPVTSREPMRETPKFN